ncbi:hypothetical protein BAU18_001842 [Enterococcus diestrammenae]|jgi:hypothetical protein|uniref:Uncharacterized protein n=1 Tax=Enterococcus diestrammenae TaxID=1155073 RepID=A0ABV0F2H0_9ENTE|nr:MAG TPA: hypothetical protein [Caudoviricetes sp.]
MGRLLSRHLTGYQKPKEVAPAPKSTPKRKPKAKKEEAK